MFIVFTHLPFRVALYSNRFQAEFNFDSFQSALRDQFPLRLFLNHQASLQNLLAGEPQC